MPAAAETDPVAESSAALDVAFQELRGRVAQVQPELSRLGEALGNFGEQLSPADAVSSPELAAHFADAQAVLRGHDEVLRRFALYTATVTHWRDAGQEIERLADLLNFEGDRILRVVAERPARADSGPDVLATAHTAYRQEMTALVDAARKMHEQMQVIREHERLAGARSGGRDDPRFRQLVTQFGEGFADAAVYLPSTPPELFRPRERPADSALDVALIWDAQKSEWYRVLGSAPVEDIFRDAYIAHGQRPTPEQLKTLATNAAQNGLRGTAANEFAQLVSSSGDPALAQAVERSDADGAMRGAIAELWLFRSKYAYDEKFRGQMHRFLGRLHDELATDANANAAPLRRLDELASRFNVVVESRAEKGELPAVGAVRVVSWPSRSPAAKSTSIWRFDQERVTVEIAGRQVLGQRKGNVVTSDARAPRQNCMVKDTRTFAAGGTLTFTAVQTCTRRGGRTRVREVSGAGTWELLPQSEKASDQNDKETPMPKTRGPS